MVMRQKLARAATKKRSEEKREEEGDIFGKIK